MPKLKSNVSEEQTASTSQSEEQVSRNPSKELLKKFMEEESKVVRGKFVNHETPGGSTKVFIKKYPGIPPFEMVLEDGKVYEVPLYVARHLNGTDITATKMGSKLNTCAYPVHGFRSMNGNLAPSDPNSLIPVPIIAPAKWVRRYSFESLEFSYGD